MIILFNIIKIMHLSRAFTIRYKLRFKNCSFVILYSKNITLQYRCHSQFARKKLTLTVNVPRCYLSVAKF